MHEFSYCVFPYLSSSDAERKASELNMGLFLLIDSFHGGDLPESYCGFETDTENTVVSCIKEGYDGGGDVIRLYEMEGRDTEQTIKLFGKEIKLHIRANGVETLADDGRRLDITEF